jgi:hypothetical protein
MRQAIAVVAVLFAALFAVSAWAVDVVTSVEVQKAGKTVFKQTNTFVGMSPAEAKALNAAGMKTLDHANKLTERPGCDYDILWNWAEDGKAQPELLTQKMCFGGVNSTMRLGTKWLNGVIDGSEKHEKAKKGRPWGNQ